MKEKPTKEEVVRIVNKHGGTQKFAEIIHYCKSTVEKWKLTKKKPKPGEWRLILFYLDNYNKPK